MQRGTTNKRGCSHESRHCTFNCTPQVASYQRQPCCSGRNNLKSPSNRSINSFRGTIGGGGGRCAGRACGTDRSSSGGRAARAGGAGGVLSSFSAGRAADNSGIPDGIYGNIVVRNSSSPDDKLFCGCGNVVVKNATNTKTPISAKSANNANNTCNSNTTYGTSNSNNFNNLSGVCCRCNKPTCSCKESQDANKSNNNSGEYNTLSCCNNATSSKSRSCSAGSGGAGSFQGSNASFRANYMPKSSNSNNGKKFAIMKSCCGQTGGNTNDYDKYDSCMSTSGLTNNFNVGNYGNAGNCVSGSTSSYGELGLNSPDLCQKLQQQQSQLDCCMCQRCGQNMNIPQLQLGTKDSQRSDNNYFPTQRSNNQMTYESKVSGPPLPPRSPTFQIDNLQRNWNSTARDVQGAQQLGSSQQPIYAPLSAPSSSPATTFPSLSAPTSPLPTPSPSLSAPCSPQSASCPPLSAPCPTQSASCPPLSAPCPPQSASCPPLSAPCSQQTTSCPPVSEACPPVSSAGPPNSAACPPVSASRQPASTSCPPLSASCPISPTSQDPLSCMCPMQGANSLCSSMSPMDNKPSQVSSPFISNMSLARSRSCGPKVPSLQTEETLRNPYYSPGIHSPSPSFSSASPSLAGRSASRQQTPEQEYKCRVRKQQMEDFVKDQYCPGIIQSTIDNEVDFNEMSFRLVFGGKSLPCTKPCVEPISLLEAFCMRVDLERCLFDKRDAMYEEMPRRQGRRSSINDVDLTSVDEYFARHPATQLNLALSSLLKAEKCYYSNNPRDDVPSMSALINKTTTELPDRPIKIIAYNGNTKPLDS